jgi:SNF2 family DNA or RNA helicase
MTTMLNSKAFAVGFERGLQKAASVAAWSKVADIVTKMQPHQEEARLRAHQVPGGQILNWGLGSGKSLGALAVAEDRGGNTLIVAPAALRENYLKEIKKHVSKDRHSSYKVISYDEFRNDPFKWISKVQPNTVIADEFHRVRNDGANRRAFEETRKYMPYLVANTGSLINNHPTELVPLVNLVAGGPVLGSEADFKRKFLQEKKVPPNLLGRITGHKPGIVEEIKNPKELKKVLSPYVHRFTGNDEYKKELPDVKQEDIKVPMTAHQERIYKAILKTNPGLAYKIKANLPPAKKDLKNLNAFSTALRQISNDPSSFDVSIHDRIKESPKFKRMIEEQRRRANKDPNFRAIVYSGFLGAGVDPVIEGARNRGIKAQVFSGQLSDGERKRVVEDFNKGHTKVLGVSPAGGEGLDLKGVRLVQLAEGHWNPERGAQAIGRAVRFRSHAHLPQEARNVLVQRYLATRPKHWYHKLPGIKPQMSVDEWIEKRREEKKHLNDQFLHALG